MTLAFQALPKLRQSSLRFVFVSFLGVLVPATKKKTTVLTKQNSVACTQLLNHSNAMPFITYSCWFAKPTQFFFKLINKMNSKRARTIDRYA